jgi:gas vesicle protein
MRKLRWQETVSAFVVGIGVGAAIGILFAPQSGEDTRDYLVGGAQDTLDGAASTGRKWVRRAKSNVDDATDYVKKNLDGATDYVKKNVDDATDYVKDAAGEGQRAYREAKKASA